MSSRLELRETVSKAIRRWIMARESGVMKWFSEGVIAVMLSKRTRQRQPEMQVSFRLQNGLQARRQHAQELQ